MLLYSCAQWSRQCYSIGIGGGSSSGLAITGSAKVPAVRKRIRESLSRPSVRLAPLTIRFQRDANDVTLVESDLVDVRLVVVHGYPRVVVIFIERVLEELDAIHSLRFRWRGVLDELILVHGRQGRIAPIAVRSDEGLLEFQDGRLLVDGDHHADCVHSGVSASVCIGRPTRKARD